MDNCLSRIFLIVPPGGSLQVLSNVSKHISELEMREIPGAEFHDDYIPHYICTIKLYTFFHQNGIIAVCGSLEERSLVKFESKSMLMYLICFHLLLRW